MSADTSTTRRVPCFLLATIITRRGKQEAEAFDVKVLQGRSARRRLGICDYRVVCTVEDGRLIVRVLAVGDRRDAYRRVP
ncbi:type II toxin-antitoxin system RelE family toxin [Actinocorallia aurantiaca]|uniref:mRNA interferase RelE/StbE n=1 Tax=Actinocorallia aurantiaca TaxID=46204 RepID=A0ABP6GL01_9ACTN